MIFFCETSSVLQILLLILSQFTVIIFIGGQILLFKRKCKQSKQLGVCVLLIFNIILYVIMQLDSRITAGEQRFHVHIPYAGLLFATLISLLFLIWLVLGETKNRKTLSSISIKESFDNLPAGVCFFNEAGLPVLCNRAMHRFSFAVCGKDVQFITDLNNCLEEDFAPVTEVKKEGKVFALSDGSSMQLKKRIITHESGNIYTQFIALNVTELQEKRVELQQENEQLRQVQEDLRKLSANVVAITREEEILNTKMRVHDEMGRCLVAAQKYLKEDCTESIPDSVVIAWQRAIAMIKHSSETADEDMLLQIRKTCKSVNLGFIQTGKLPEEEILAYILTCAVRECVTNAVRYANATELYADFTENESEATVSVSNNGEPPESEIVEGGGLSTLRRRVERAGGTMTVYSLPKFKLMVTVPKEKKDVL